MSTIQDPNVYFNQIDNSTLTRIGTQNGATIIGAFQSGPAFVPTVVDANNYQLFGQTDGILYAPYALKEYINNGNKNPVVIRTLWNTPYTKNLRVINSGSNIVAILASTTTASTATISTTGTKYVTYLKGSTVISGSVNSADQDNILNMFTTNPRTTNDYYVYYWDKSYTTLSGSVGTGSNVVNSTNSPSQNTYSYSTTPYICDYNGNNLFKFQNLSDGNVSNSNIKVVISNIRPGSSTVYTKFDVIIRSFSDTDANQVVLQSYSNVDLNPNSTSYISRVIGDMKIKYDTSKSRLTSAGNYSNKSSYVRVVVSDAVDTGNISATSIPWKYTISALPISSAIIGTISTSAWYVTSSLGSNGLDNTKIVYGLDYSNTKNNVLFNPTVSTQYSASYEFSLGNCACTSGSTTVTTGSDAKYLKFVVPFYGGCDGINPSDSFSGLNGFDVSAIASTGTTQLGIALDLCSSKQYFDTDLICIPGLSIYRSTNVGGKYLINKLIEICQAREDCFPIFDMDDNTIDSSTALSTLTTALDDYDTSYGACYYPYVKLYDSVVEKYVWLPATVAVIGAYAYCDKISFSWFAPAGFNRAGLGSVKDIKYKLSQKQRADLYNARINPVAYFPNMGPVIWGQKTLQKTSSALDRINVRRLVIKIKKFINNVGLNILWDPNTSVLWNRFLQQVKPYMTSLVELQGLRAFEVVMDAALNTPDMIDRNILKGKVIIQPTRAAQYIVIDFNINATTAE